MIRFAAAPAPTTNENRQQRSAAVQSVEPSDQIEPVQVLEPGVSVPELEPLVLSAEPPPRKSKKPRVARAKKPKGEAQVSTFEEEVIAPLLLNLDPAV